MTILKVTTKNLNNRFKNGDFKENLCSGVCWLDFQPFWESRLSLIKAISTSPRRAHSVPYLAGHVFFPFPGLKVPLFRFQLQVEFQ